MVGCNLIAEITDEFVELFETDESTYTGVFGRLVGMGQLPEGVDPQDERVIKIMSRCSELINRD